jgi:ankyrin repeat protein
MVAVLLRVLLVLVVVGLTLDRAAAQIAPPTPFTGVPKVPKTLPLLGRPTADGLVLKAAIDGNADQIDWLMAAGGDCDEADALGRTALMHAAMANFSAVATALLAHDARLDLRDRVGNTALHWAAQTGSTAAMRVLLAAHATVDAIDSKGQTPLMLAAGNNRPEAVRLLLQYHADPHKTDYTGRDALGWGQSYPRIETLLATSTASR